MKLYAAADGALLATAITAADEAMIGTPAGLAETLAADETANEALAADLLAAPRAYRLSAGTLQKNGQPVAVAAAGTAYTDRQQLQAIRDALETYFALQSPTAAQSAAALKQTIRALRVVLQALNRRGLL